MLVDIRHQSPDLYLDVLLQSLSVLSRLNETLDYVQKQLHEQFHRIVLRTTQHIVDNNFVLHSNNSHQNLLWNNPDCLRDLLETCYEQFKLVVKNIEYLLNILKSQSNFANEKKEKYFDEQDKYNKEMLSTIKIIDLQRQNSGGGSKRDLNENNNNNSINSSNISTGDDDLKQNGIKKAARYSAKRNIRP